MKRTFSTMAALGILTTLPKMQTRRMPGLTHNGYAAYKSDGGDDEIEVLSARVKQFNEDNKILVKETKEAKAEIERITKEYEDKVAGINKTMGEKDATLKAIKEEVDQLKAKTGDLIKGFGAPQQRGVYAQDLIAKAIKDNAPAISKGVIGTTWNTDPIPSGMVWREKAAGIITLGANVTGATISATPTFANEVASRGYDETHFRDIFSTFESATGTFAFYRSNTPPGEGSFGTTAPGVAKNPVDKDLTLITVNADYINGYADIAKQSLQDVPVLQSFLNEELNNDFLDRETFHMFSALVGQSTGPNPGTGSNLVEKIIYLIAAQKQLKYRTNAIIVRPAKWAEILVTKPNDYSVPGGIIITPQGNIAIVGLPVYTTATNALTDTKILLGDTRKAKIMQVTGEGMKMELFQQHDKAVYQNLLTMRVEAREELVQTRLDAFSYVTA